MAMHWMILPLLVVGTLFIQPQECGIIKDIFQKVTNTGNKTEDVVKQSAPICGSGAFSSPNEAALSPEIFFITNRPSKVTSSQGNNGYGNGDYNSNDNYNSGNNYNNNNGRDYERSSSQESERRRGNNNNNNNSSPNGGSSNRGGRVAEVANEYSFHVENVTLHELEQRGFNRDAPVSFLMHGFTSGYPLQAWISAIVEAYTIDRQSNQGDHSSTSTSHSSYDNNQERRRGSSSSSSHFNSYQSNTHNSGNNSKLKHNLFIVNWNYAARGILYPRAVANIPIVASYVTRFINDKLLEEARIPPERIQLIGHSLGAHLAGFIGKNTRQKVGRIYGLDPAGPCFGTLSGPLYPASKRLAPSDAQEVITVQTNSALLGIDKPLGRHSIYVEGGAKQPGCKGGGPLKSFQTLTWDGGDFDAVACSHSRAPNLLTYRHDQSDTEDDCQMVAYACKDWDSFIAGHCGVCEGEATSSNPQGGGRNVGRGQTPMQPVACRRIGLEWQYYKVGGGGGGSSSQWPQSGNNNNNAGYGSSNGGYQNNGYDSNYNSNYNSGNSNNNNNNGYGREQYDNQPSRRRVNKNERTRRQTYQNSTTRSEEKLDEKRGYDSSIEPISMFLRTGDTQPYCTFHYQIILELNEAFPNRGKPPMSIILQDSETTGETSSSRQPSSTSRKEQNSLSSDEFGNKFDERTYTHLLTSSKKLKKIDHGTLIFRNGLENGHQLFKALHINYMSHSSPQVRRRLSSRLCPVRTDTDRSRQNSSNRFYFKPCDSMGSSSSSSSGGGYAGGNQREPVYGNGNNANQNNSGYNNENNQNNGYQNNNSNSNSYGFNQNQSGNYRERESQQNYRNRTSNYGSTSSNW